MSFSRKTFNFIVPKTLSEIGGPIVSIDSCKLVGVLADR